MAAPKQARTRPRDKGTRGGRPDPQAAAAAPRRPGNGQGQPASGQGRPGNGQGRPGNGQPARGQGRPGGAARADGRPRGGQVTVGPARAVRAEPVEGGAARVPLWLRVATLVLSLGGLGVSVYLTIAHYTSSAILACSEKGIVNCGAVTTSPESMVFGIFPVAVLGLAFYVFLAGINSPWAWRAKWPLIGWARVASLAVGMVFVLYLIYTELFTIGAICLWCTSVHVITFLLFALTMFGVAAGYTAARPPARR